MNIGFADVSEKCAQAMALLACQNAPNVTRLVDVEAVEVLLQVGVRIR
jgi:hypothetical protein